MSLSNLYPAIRPSLLLDFANSGALDPRITFTRASSGTYFGPDGVLKTAQANAPRLDYDPSTLEARGLLIEEARTNLLTYSEEFDNASVWTTLGGSTVVTANTQVAPDGTTTADTVLAGATTATHLIQQTGISLANATQYTFSVFVKDAGESVLWMRVASATTPFGVSTGAVASFDLTAVTAAPSTYGTTASITPVGNGWYRCSATTVATIAAGTSSFQLVIRQPSSWTGTGTTGFYMWGAQLEEGEFPTSYIPTTSASVTRAVDVAQVNTVSPWYNASEGTLCAEVMLPSLPTTGTFPNFVSINDGSANENLSISSNDTGARRVIVRSGGASVWEANAGGTLTVNVASKWALGAKSGNFGSAYDGVAGSTSSLVGFPTGITQMQLGRRGLSNQSNVWIRRVTYYPLRLSQAELQAITR
jgi:hypothetical protein